jgi:hypothetical protein
VWPDAAMQNICLANNDAVNGGPELVTSRAEQPPIT